jgi:F-type H+-transporting ATPase subunit delta
MSEYRVSARYAKSILDLANEQKCLDAVLADMKAFNATVAANKELRNLLSSPIVHGDKKLSVLKSIFEKGFQKLTISFFDIVIRKKREALLVDIANNFIVQYNEMHQIASATVKSAITLSESALNEIKTHIESQTGKKISLTAKVDSNLIGGVVVQIGDRLFDASVSGKLGKLKQELLNSYISK